MTIDSTCARLVQKPWGSTDLQPWSEPHHDGVAVGELWFDRADASAPPPALLFKLLFTKEPLSIQVHPDDAFAQSIGLPHGKAEAWYILSATPDAKIAVGLKHPVAASQLRAAIADGSIADLVLWSRVVRDDAIFVPAGTIHALGAGLVLAEIQQRSDATFRLFDHGRPRDLHVDNAVAAAHLGPVERQSVPRRVGEARTLLVASPHFVLERIDLAPRSTWELRATSETWAFIIGGHARIGPISATAGEAVFLDDDYASIEVGFGGLKGLLAYSAAEPNPDLLHRRDAPRAGTPDRQFALPPSEPRVVAGSRIGAQEARS